MTDFTVVPGASYTITDKDRLLFPALAKTHDVNGVAISKGGSNGIWQFEFYVGGKTVTAGVKDNAALRFDAMEGSLFAYTMPVKITTVTNTVTVEKDVLVYPPAPPVYAQRNGMSLSNSQNGYYENVQTQVAAYVLSGGARAMRVPVKHDLLWQNGAIQDAITLNGYKTKQWLALTPIIDFNLANDVVTVIDDHKYLPIGNPDVLAFWLALGAKLKAMYGNNDKIVLELQNETSQGGWETNWATNLKTVVAALRAAGITYPLIAGWGNWNAVGSYARALSELDAVGGPDKIDPLGKLSFSAHHYPTTSGNDQPKSGQSAPQINGSAVNAGFKAMFDEFKKRGLKIWITEVGSGGGAHGWLGNGSGVAAFDGKAWFTQFTALIAQYPDTVSGVLMWGGGQSWKDDYPFKIEWTKGDWDASKSTEFWQMASAVWQNKHFLPA